MILALHTVDCFGCRLAMTIRIFCHVERSETSLSDSMSFDSLVFISLCDSERGFFLQGGQGG